MTNPPPKDALRELLEARLGAQYAIEGLLGKGGMGSVYRGRDLTLDRAVAIKVIGNDATATPELRERFLLEARTVAKLRHPNIVAVHSAGDADGMLYFVMELVPGESLRDLLTRETKVAPERAERILPELALALDYAHATGIVHRDVKPENLLLDGESGRAMLMDFGVARALEGDGRMTGTGMILGSPRYMSPEQAAGEATLDGRSDLYALALVGYEMCTGKPVVEAANIAGMLVKHLTETPAPLSAAAPEVPEGVAAAIDRALVKDRDARWATGREMADMIGAGWTPSGSFAGAGTRSLTGAARGAAARARRVRRIAGAGIVLAVVAGVAWAMLSRDGAPRGIDPRRSYAVVPFEVQSGNRDIGWLRDGAVNMLTLAMSQWRDLTVADYERTMVLVREAGLEDKRVDLDRALEIARRAGAWTVVTGTITTTADSLRVDARLYDVASGRSLSTETRAAALADDPRPLFDGLARYLLGVAGGTATETVDLAAATTTSLVAYRAYLEGVRALFTWRMPEADSLFQVAIAADSGFALAWHKRALALGWGDATGPAYRLSTRRAVELSQRLPAREQALTKGHEALARGLGSQTTGGDGGEAYREAQAAYGALIATDSGVAEAWYGYADALFHEQPADGAWDQHAARTARSLRAFRRTLALDSTFLLAYSHLVQMYQNFSTPQNPFVIDGDTVRFLGDTAAVRRVGGPPAVAAMRARARSTGFELARRWSVAAPEAPAPVISLAQGFMAAGMPDSAVATIDGALTRPALQTLGLRLQSGIYQVLADDPRGVRTLLDATGELDSLALRRLPFFERFSAQAMAISVAGASGNGGELQAAEQRFVAADPMMPFSSQPSAPIIRWFATGVEIAMRGDASAEQRRLLRAGLGQIDRAEGGSAQQVRSGAIPVAYTAYLVTRDTAFLAAVRRWSGPQAAYPELDAREALERGDTTAARRIATGFTPGDSLGGSRFAAGGLRTVLRAGVLEDLGNPREAVKNYEALHPSRFNLGLIDPGFAAYVRTFAARAALYEQLGERDKAIASYEEFLRRWQDGDAVTEPARAAARAALQRLRDTPPANRR